LSIVTTGGSGSNPNPGKDQPSGLHSRLDESSGTLHHILIVEDNEADVFLIREAIATTELAVSVHVAQDGEQAIAFLDQVDTAVEAPLLALIILDINLPRKPGYAVVRHLQKSTRSRKTQVIVVSTSDSDRDRAQMAELGIERYFRKPTEYGAFMKLGDLVKSVLTPGPHG
jgi:CheY-like chemotaxis protein